MSGAQIAERAKAQLGVPFRLHGRLPGEALDCVGLVAVALGDLATQPVPIHYSLRGDFLELVARFFAHNTFQKCCAPFQDGDIVIVRAAPGQLHLIVCASDGFVHAHAGLRKIVFTPGAPLWPVLGHWRFIGE
jgi:murein DD-endopeptidase / murein LD-carboxypeptidase